MSKRQCRECGGEFTSRQYNAEFCGAPCRRSFNNRRATRGAILYDLVLIERADPKGFAANKLETRVEELIERWREEDATAKRSRTWKRPNDVMYDTAALLR
jgi:hypothetical protein